MKQVVNPSGPTMSSLELVDFINDQRKLQAFSAGMLFPCEGYPKLLHKNFLAKVPEVLGETSAEFSADLPDGYGRSRRGYSFPKREACLMAMSYSYDLQAKVFDRMTELERSAAPSLPASFAEALRLAADQAEQIEQQQKALAIAAPKVEFVEQYVESTGTMTFRQVAKLLKANEREFRRFLEEMSIMYKLGGEWTAYQNHIQAGRFEVRTGTATHNDHAFTSAKFTPKGVEYVSGLWRKHMEQA